MERESGLHLRRQLHLHPVHADVLHVLGHVRIPFRANLDVLDVEVRDHLLDLGLVAARGGGHSQYQTVVVLVSLGHCNISVVADRPVRLVEDDELDVLQVQTAVLQVVGDHLRRGSDDVVLQEGQLPFQRIDLAGHHADALPLDHVLHRTIMLLDQRSRRRQKEHLAALGMEHLGDDHRGHDGLAQPGREHQERAGHRRAHGQVHLVVAPLHALPLDQGVLKIHDGLSLSE